MELGNHVHTVIEKDLPKGAVVRGALHNNAFGIGYERPSRTPNWHTQNWHSPKRPQTAIA